MNMTSPGRRDWGIFSFAHWLHRPDVEEKTVDSDIPDELDIRSASSRSVIVDRHLASMLAMTRSARVLDVNTSVSKSSCSE